MLRFLSCKYGHFKPNKNLVIFFLIHHPLFLTMGIYDYLLQSPDALTSCSDGLKTKMNHFSPQLLLSTYHCN